MDKNSQIFTKGLQSKYGTDEYVKEMQELKFELNQNKETNRTSIFTAKEKMQAVNLLAKQKADLEKQMKSKGGTTTKNRIGGNDYRKGGYVLSTVDNKKKKQ
jgi:hypothetical protein|tara:strand:+ start:42 stop:347 length:306 start_codon:yes stop_codon:yes gene_type:complete